VSPALLPYVLSCAKWPVTFVIYSRFATLSRVKPDESQSEIHGESSFVNLTL